MSSQTRSLQALRIVLLVLWLGVNGLVMPPVRRSTQIETNAGADGVSKRMSLISFAQNVEVSAEEDFYDLVVVGTGPVGVRSAMRAAELGHKVMAVDGSATSDISFGGPTGLFSKALRDTAKRIAVDAFRGLGMDDESIWTQIRNECVRLATTNAQAMRRELLTTGATIKRGSCSIEGSAQKGEAIALSVGPKQYHAKYVLLATGSTAFQPSGIPFDGKRVFDSDSINGLSYLPRSIAITGSGIVALEYAKIFKNLGSEVTLVFRGASPKKALEKTGLDKDLTAALVSDLRRSGVSFAKSSVCTDFEVPPAMKSGNTHIKRRPISITLAPSDGKGPGRKLKVDAYLAAVGRRPNYPQGLDSIGIQVDEYGNVQVESDLSSAACPRLFAAGDVIGRPFLASTGVAQGLRAVDRIDKLIQIDAGVDDTATVPFPVPAMAQAFGAAFDAGVASQEYPVGVWTSPEVAWFGLSISQAKNRDIPAIEGMALYKESLRGVVFSPDGLLKLVADESTNEIIGVHIVGTDACEIIHYGMELVRAKRTLSDVVAATYSAVTFHELYQIAARACLDQEGARIRRRAAGAAWAASQQEIRADELAWEEDDTASTGLEITQSTVTNSR